MYAVLKSFGLKGLNGFPVEVEADISGGMPALSIVGLPDSAVRESGDRVHAALKNLGFKWPDRRITINLAPADVRKTGPVYDLPLLLAVLAASGQLETPPRPLRPAAARCRSSPLQRPVRSWTLCGASSPSRLQLLFPSTLPTHGTMSLISPTSAVSRWPAGRWSLPLQAGTTSCSSAHPAPANPCWPGVFPASCPR